MLAFTLGLALVTTLLFGLAPAISGTRQSTSAPRSSPPPCASAKAANNALLRHGLLVLEVALAVVLLASAGLLVRSFVNVMHYDSGFDSSNTLTGFNNSYWSSL